MNYLICWIENNIKKWEMVKKADWEEFAMELLLNVNIDKHSIFIVPESSILSGIWLCPDTHKSNKVDFFNFFDDLGIKYEKPKISDDAQTLANKYKEEHHTLYGWISPTGQYFHCEYQGHNSLADNICFGMIETNNPSFYLETHGWIKIFKPFSGGKYSVYMGENCIANDNQIKTLEGLGLLNANGISTILIK